jgi:hypothetical protein
MTTAAAGRIRRLSSADEHAARRSEQAKRAVVDTIDRPIFFRRGKVTE